MHIRKQMPFTTSQILSERLRRPQVNAPLACDCSKAPWSLVATRHQTIVDTLCQARQKEAVGAPLQAQAHRTTSTGAIEETMRFILPLQSSASCGVQPQVALHWQVRRGIGSLLHAVCDVRMSWLCARHLVCQRKVFHGHFTSYSRQALGALPRFLRDHSLASCLSVNTQHAVGLIRHPAETTFQHLCSVSTTVPLKARRR